MNEGGRAWIPFSGLARVVDTDLSGCVCLAGPCLWTWKAAASVARHLFPSSTNVCLLRKHSSFRCPQLTAPPAGASLLEKVFFFKKNRETTRRDTNIRPPSPNSKGGVQLHRPTSTVLPTTLGSTPSAPFGFGPPNYLVTHRSPLKGTGITPRLATRGTLPMRCDAIKVRQGGLGRMRPGNIFKLKPLAFRVIRTGR
jgi:hypothetical protein